MSYSWFLASETEIPFHHPAGVTLSRLVTKTLNDLLGEPESRLLFTGK